MNNIILVKVDTNYCNYLRKYDSKVPYNYDEKKDRPFVGVLFEVEKFKYFAPLSSPKKKHLMMHSTIDFLKIDGGKLGAINFNNMIPVTENNIIKIELNKPGKNLANERYLKLLKEQLYWLNRNDAKLFESSRKLYNKYISGTLNSRIAKRCCNFILLEQKCLEYNEVKVI